MTEYKPTAEDNSLVVSIPVRHVDDLVSNLTDLGLKVLNRTPFEKKWSPGC